MPAALKKFAGQNEYWSYRRVVQGLLYLPSLLQTLPAFLKILTLSNMLGLLAAQPMLPFKYLSRFYIVQGLPVRARALALTHHYSFLQSRLRSVLLGDILHGRALIFETLAGDSTIKIYLTSSPPMVKEGEMSLYLQRDGADIYVLSFSFVPGRIVGMAAENVILIARVQGIKNCFPQIRAATKALGDISPPALLMSALQGIAEALDITSMAGVSAAHQVCKATKRCPELDTSYDEFFIALGAEKNALNFFVSALPIIDKPIQLIKSDHRARTLRKRRFKRDAADAVCNLIFRNKAAPVSKISVYHEAPITIGQVAEAPQV